MVLKLVQFPSSDHSFSKLLRPPMCQAHRNLLMYIPYRTAFLQWIKYKTSSDSSLEPYFRGQISTLQRVKKKGCEASNHEKVFYAWDPQIFNFPELYTFPSLIFFSEGKQHGKE